MNAQLWNFLTAAQWAEAARKTAAMGEPDTVEEYRADMVLKEIAGEEPVGRFMGATICRCVPNAGGSTFRRYQ